jgi:uncharacterized Fe-S cluster protein YjdI
MKDITKKYTNGEITIVWKPNTCIHSTLCWKGVTGLNQVFNPLEKPWIKMDGASTEKIIEQIKKCPSGALSFYFNNEAENPTEVKVENIVEVLENGPLLVYGNLTVKDKSGREEHKNKVTAFCRCGHSSNKPYCDGTHAKMGFKA